MSFSKNHSVNSEWFYFFTLNAHNQGFTKQINAMKKLILVILFMLSYGSSIAQNNKFSEDSPGRYLLGFQEFTGNNPNADSAYYCIQKLNSRKEFKNIFEMIIHSYFAMGFVQKDLSKLDSMKVIEEVKKRVLYKKILAKIMTDTSQNLIATVKPIFYLSRIQDNQDKVSEVKKLTKGFIDSQLSPNLIYANKTATYGLMIYQIIAKKGAMKPLSQQLFGKISTHLKDNQIVDSETLERRLLERRGWYRYLYGYVNFVKANETNDVFMKENYLNMAYQYSPDRRDQIFSSSYFYDSMILGKDGFSEDYLNFLENNSTDKNKVLPILLSIALLEPSNKDRLKRHFLKDNSSENNFNKFWLEAVNNSGKNAPEISLSQLNTKVFDSKELTDKWILLDFWGTWCGPCRAEHPELQTFYDSFITKNNKKIVLMTVACRDKKEEVLSYMKEKNYTFPVAMEDDKIAKNYDIQGYPTKILISPQGKYIIIPLNADFINFVKEYTNL